MTRPKSKKPKKQRKFMHTASLHTRRKLMASHLSPGLKKQYNRRSFPVRKGDEVVVMRGKFKKRSGKVARLDTKKYRVYIEGIMVKRTDGTERQAPIHPSNLMISKVYLDDKKRMASLSKKAPKKAQKSSPKKTATKQRSKKASEKESPEKKKEKKG